MDLMMMPTAAPANDAQDVIASVLAKHNVPVLAQKPAPVPVAVAAPIPAPVAPIAQPVAAAPAIDDNKASQDKVKEMAQKLGVPFTDDLMALGSNSAISDALIEKAVNAGKTEEQINAAMAQL